jgi:hypothetical protein
MGSPICLCFVEHGYGAGLLARGADEDRYAGGAGRRHLCTDPGPIAYHHGMTESPDDFMEGGARTPLGIS